MARLANPALAERRRRQIMDAAILCFRRRGFHQTTMAEICAAAQISAGAIYHYFGSKADIIGAIIEDACGEDRASFLQTAQQKGLIEALCLKSADYFQRLADGDGAVAAELLAESMRDDAVAAAVRAADTQSIRDVVAAILAAQARGEVDPQLDPDLAAQTIGAAVNGIGLRCAFLREQDPQVALNQFRAFLERYLSKARE